MYHVKRYLPEEPGEDLREVTDMKQICKRTMSLLLSGVLLLSNFPLAALATEETTVPTETTVVETQPVETEPLQTQPVETQSVETQPVVTVLEHTAEVANIGSVSKLQIAKGGNSVSAEWLEANYIGEQNQLTLNAETLDSVSCTDASLPLKLVLTEGTTITISGALTAQKGIQITGKGTLIVGSIDAGENLEIVDAVVKVGSDKQSEEETKNLIKVKNEIKVSGEAHLVTANGHNAVVFTVNDENVQKRIVGQGYYRTTTDGDFAEVTDKIASVSGSYFEFVANGHLEAEKVDDDNHAWFCKKICDKDCVIKVTAGIDLKEHIVSTAAGCEKSAHCDVCGEDFGQKDNTHSGNEVWDPSSEKHIKKYDCCGKVTYPEEPHVFSYEYLADSATVKKKCTECGYSEEVFKVTVPTDMVWDGNAKSVAITPENTTYTYDVEYYEALEGENEAPPSGEVESMDSNPIEPGTYWAVVTVTIEGELYEIQKKFVIEPVDMQDLTVTISSESETFRGLNEDVTHPVETVMYGTDKLAKSTHYVVEFYSGTSKVTSLNTVGAYKIKIIGKSPYVTGETERTFSVTKAAPSADMFDFAEPSVLTYNGEVKNAAVTPKSGITGMGNVTLKYYKNNALVEGSVIDAGDYTVKISVADGTNYAATTTDLTDAEWVFSIAKCPDYTDDLEKNEQQEQLIVEGSGDFIEPTFTGKKRTGSDTAENLDGTLKYTLNTEINLSVLKGELAGLKHGDEKTVTYTFQPEKDGNYTGVKTGRIRFVVKEVVFLLDDEEDFQAADLVKSGNITYGDADIINTNDLSAKSGNDTISDVDFTVEYESVQRRSAGRKTSPDAGENDFFVIATGTVGGFAFRKEVCSGRITVLPKEITITAPEEKLWTEEKNQDNTPKEHNLIDAIRVTDPAAGAEIQYYKEGQTPATSIPTASAAGRYKVYYRITADNYKTKEGFVWSTIQPELTATYGDTLADVEGVPADGKWVWALNNTVLAQDKLSEHDVGPYGINDDFQMVYNNSDPFTVKINVDAKPVTDPIIDAATYIHYDDRASVAVKVYDPMDATKDNDNVEIPASEYEAKIDEIASRTGWTTITVRDKKEDGNYVITTKTKDVLLYRPYHVAFSTLQTDDDLKETEFDTVAKVKTELSSKIKANEYPEDIMKYFKIMMTYDNTPTDGKENWIASRELDKYYPKGGFTYVIPYSVIGTGLTADHDFKMSVMDAATSDELETEAGTPAVEITDFEKTEKGIKFHYDGYSVVCIAPKVDLTKTYAIKTSIIYDGKSSTKGSLSIKVDNKTASAATYGQSVEVTASANSGYSIQSVKVTDANSKTVTTSQSGSKYTFKMPASDVTVKLTLKKTTSNTKNPGSGDTSNIHLWLAILASSAVGIVALVIFWFKKRRK